MPCFAGWEKIQCNAMENYSIQHTKRSVRSIIKEIVYVAELNELKIIEGQTSIEKNDIARIQIKTTNPLFF